MIFIGGDEAAPNSKAEDLRLLLERQPGDFSKISAKKKVSAKYVWHAPKASVGCSPGAMARRRLNNVSAAISIGTL